MKRMMKNWDDTYDLVEVIRIDHKNDLVEIKFTDMTRQKMSWKELLKTSEKVWEVAEA